MGFSQTGLTPPPTNVAVDARRIPLEQEMQIVAQARAVCVVIALSFDAAHPKGGIS